EERVVPADTDVGAGLEARTALPDQDRTGGHLLAAEFLHAEALRFTVAAVARTANSLFVSHCFPTLPLSRSRLPSPRARRLTPRPAPRPRAPLRPRQTCRTCPTRRTRPSPQP